MSSRKIVPLHAVQASSSSLPSEFSRQKTSTVDFFFIEIPESFSFYRKTYTCIDCVDLGFVCNWNRFRNSRKIILDDERNRSRTSSRLRVLLLSLSLWVLHELQPVLLLLIIIIINIVTSYLPAGRRHHCYYLWVIFELRSAVSQTNCPFFRHRFPVLNLQLKGSRNY